MGTLDLVSVMSKYAVVSSQLPPSPLLDNQQELNIASWVKYRLFREPRSMVIEVKFILNPV